MLSIIKSLYPILGLCLLLIILRFIVFIIEEIIDRFFYSENVKEKIRNKPTKEAVKLATELTKLGYYAELEKYDGYKHIDIAIVKAKTNIEIDGSYHNYKANAALQDLKRTFYSLEKGYITLRIPNSLVKYRLTETVNYLDKILKIRTN